VSTPDAGFLLRQEIKELTNLLRTEPDWESLRATLRSRDLQPTDVLLISFYEDENDGEYGAIVTVRDRKIFEYQRSTAGDAQCAFSLWRELAASGHTVVQYPQIPEALRMLDEGTIS
jgi:hypothetical protein